MYVRIVTFGLTIPVEAYTAQAVHIAPGFTAWPGRLGAKARSPARGPGFSGWRS